MENECSEHKLNEEKFERIEKLLEKLSNTVDIKNAELTEDIKKLTEDFNNLKEDYIAIKNSVFITVKNLEGVPNAINKLEKALITINNSILNHDGKIDVVNEKLTKLEEKVEANEEKSKFDFIAFIKSCLPSIITGGIVFLIMELIK